MDFAEALSLFGFTGNFTEENLRRKYLELSKKYHPDIGGNDEMMKNINAAYDILKGRTFNYDLSYFDSLKEKLKKFVSKSFYEPGTIEYEYVIKINQIVNSFTFNSDKKALNSSYNHILSRINDTLIEYRTKVLTNVPEKFVRKYDSNIVDFIDDFIKKMKNIKKSYDEMEKALDDVIQSLIANVDASMLEKISNMKNSTLNDIIDNKISLEDGANRLRCEIMTMIMQSEELDKAIEETYHILLDNFNARMIELKTFDNNQILLLLNAFKTALEKLQLVKDKKLGKEILPELKALDFKTKFDFAYANNEKKTIVSSDDEITVNDNYEIFITRDANANEPEFVIKVAEFSFGGNEDDKEIHYLKKRLSYSKTVVDKTMISKKSFYEKYMSIDEYLGNAEFVNKSYKDYYGNKRLVLYMLDNTIIYITNNGEGFISVCRKCDLGVLNKSDYYPHVYASKYEAMSILKKDIYEDFKKYLGDRSWFIDKIDKKNMVQETPNDGRKGR